MHVLKIGIVSLCAAGCWACGPKTPLPKQPQTGTQVSQPTQAKALPAGISAGDLCAGKPENSACWIEVVNRPGCFVWTVAAGADETVTWDGECKQGIAQGMGTQVWRWGGDQPGGAVDKGTLVDGRPQGNWVVRDQNGDEEEGPYVDGKRQGPFVIRWANGSTGEGSMVDDEMHGDWVVRHADGKVETHHYVNGERR